MICLQYVYQTYTNTTHVSQAFDCFGIGVQNTFRILTGEDPDILLLTPPYREVLLIT